MIVENINKRIKYGGLNENNKYLSARWDYGGQKRSNSHIIDKDFLELRKYVFKN
jgi:hypothetical protein